MAYLTQEDLLAELGEDVLIQLTDDESTGEVNPAPVAKAIGFAEGVFESYARTRYALPVPVTPLVQALCLDLAVYHLYRKRATFDEGTFKVKKTAHDEAIARLKDLQAGKAALDVPSSSETATHPATADEVLTNKGRTRFGDAALASF